MKYKRAARPFLARLTVYWSTPYGSDHWTIRGQSATGVRLAPGHCAVDPRLIAYGSRLLVAGRVLVAVDTGSAVRARTASRGSAPVVDVYFPHRRDALRWDRATPDYLTIQILN